MKRNTGMIVLGLFFPLAFAAEYFFLHGIGGIRYLLMAMVGASSILFLSEKEDPVEASKFYFYLALGLIPCIAMLLLFAHAQDAIL